MSRLYGIESKVRALDRESNQNETKVLYHVILPWFYPRSVQPQFTMYRTLSLFASRFHASASEISPLFPTLFSLVFSLSLFLRSSYRRIISFRRCDPWKSNTLAPVAATARSTRQLRVRSTRLWKSLRRWLITTAVSPWCFQRVHFSPRSLFKADSEISLFHTLPAITRKIASGYTPRDATRRDSA